MPYTPVNIYIYTAAYAGAISGILQSRAIANTSASRTCNSFCRSIIQRSIKRLGKCSCYVCLWRVSRLVEQNSQSYWASRRPNSVTVGNYTAIAEAVRAVVDQCSVYFAANILTTIPAYPQTLPTQYFYTFADIATLKAYDTTNVANGAIATVNSGSPYPLTYQFTTSAWPYAIDDQFFVDPSTGPGTWVMCWPAQPWITVWGAAGALAIGGTRSFPPGYAAAPSSSTIEVIAPESGYIRSLQVLPRTVGTLPGTATYAAQINGNPSLTVNAAVNSPAFTTFAGSPITNSFNQSDTISVTGEVDGGAGAAPSNHTVTLNCIVLPAWVIT